MFTIYSITRVDGLKYIGSTKNLKSRINSHKKSKRFEIGIEKFEILDTCENIDEAREKECEWISHYDTYHNGLNVTIHGGGSHDNTEKFNTLGMSFTKGKKWYNNGVKNIRCYEGEQPKDFIKGKLTYRNDTRKHSKETREKLSKIQKNRPDAYYNSKFTEEQAREIFELLKRKPKLEGVGISKDITNTTRTTYLRKFCQEYSKKFGVEEFYLYYFINNKGCKRWGKLWNEYFTDYEAKFVKNTKSPSLSITQAEELFNYYNNNKNELSKKEISNIFGKKNSIKPSLCYKALIRKGGKRLGILFNYIVSEPYSINEKKTEEQILAFFKDFIKFEGKKKEFYSKSNEYGISKSLGRKLVYNKDKGKWHYLWERIANEH